MLLPIMKMRCPCCKSEDQYIKIHYKNEMFQPSLNECALCNVRLVVQPVLEEKPNNIKISLDIQVVPMPKRMRTSMPERLKAVV